MGFGHCWPELEQGLHLLARLNGSADSSLVLAQAIGRLHLDAFTAQPHHFYLLRLVDSPEIAPDFLNKKLLVSRGPFTPEADLKLLKEHQIDLVVSKNAGGQGAYAKILAARELGIDVVMINRPVLPQRLELYHPEAVLDWLNQS